MNNLIKNPFRNEKIKNVETEYSKLGINKDDFLKKEMTLKEEWNKKAIKNQKPILSGNSEEQLWLNSSNKYYEEPPLSVPQKDWEDPSKDLSSLEQEFVDINSKIVVEEPINEISEDLPLLNIGDLTPKQFGILFNNEIVAIVNSEEELKETIEYIVYDKKSPYQVKLKDLIVIQRIGIDFGIILGK